MAEVRPGRLRQWWLDRPVRAPAVVRSQRRGQGRRGAHSGRRAASALADQRADRHRKDRIGRVQPFCGTGPRAARGRGGLPAPGATRRRALDRPHLPLARAFALAMHGELDAASTLGTGTAFTVTLPRAADIAQVPKEDSPALTGLDAPPRPSGAQARILYIEDNPANVEVVSRYLRSRPNLR